METEHKRNEKVWLGFKNLDDKDLKAVLLKCNGSRRHEQRPRKCRRMGSTNNVARILSTLPVKVTYFNVVGNRGIGDAGTDHLHLLPPTVQDLDLSKCGITLRGEYL